LVLPFFAVTLRLTEQVPLPRAFTDCPETLQTFFEVPETDRTIFLADFNETPSSRAIRELDTVAPFRVEKVFVVVVCGTDEDTVLTRGGVDFNTSVVAREFPFTTKVTSGFGAE
jgi:hypothetical protein